MGVEAKDFKRRRALDIIAGLVLVFAAFLLVAPLFDKGYPLYMIPAIWPTCSIS